MNVIQVTATHENGLVQLDGLPGWWRIDSNVCSKCGLNVWNVLLSRKILRLVCARCVPEHRDDRVVRTVSLPAIAR